MFHQHIQEQHSIRHLGKYGVVKVFRSPQEALHMMRELPSGSFQDRNRVWVPYPDVQYVTTKALTYQVDPKGVCHAS